MQCAGEGWPGCGALAMQMCTVASAGPVSARALLGLAVRAGCTEQHTAGGGAAAGGVIGTGAVQRRGRRRRDPRWEKQFCRGRVCFNAGLS